MTEQEAIRNINALNAVCGQKDFYDEELEKALGMAIKALEKQIAKKPIFKFAYEDGRKFHDCPMCGSYVTHAFEQDQVRYCNCCGQKLDWE